MNPETARATKQLAESNLDAASAMSEAANRSIGRKSRSPGKKSMIRAKSKSSLRRRHTSGSPMRSGSANSRASWSSQWSNNHDQDYIVNRYGNISCVVTKPSEETEEEIYKKMNRFRMSLCEAQSLEAISDVDDSE